MCIRDRIISAYEPKGIWGIIEKARRKR